MAAPRRAWLLGLLAAVVAVPIALDLLIETDEERVEVTLAALETACEARDVAAVLQWCGDEVALEHGLPWLPGRVDFEAALRASFGRVEELRLSREDARLEPLADGELRVMVAGDAFAAIARLGAAPFRVALTLRLADGADGRLRLVAVEALNVEPVFR